MIVTIIVPKNKLSATSRFGFFISPAIKVTLFQESLLKIDPTMEAAIAPKAAAVAYWVKLPSMFSLRRFQALLQFRCQVLLLSAQKPKMIRPNKLMILVSVKMVWITLPLLTPLVLI